jgi:hypothetical protein
MNSAFMTVDRQHRTNPSVKNTTEASLSLYDMGARIAQERKKKQ